ncbi:MAG: hypothetical protein WCC14_02635 [Acidobacteriaceae bacterium]
MQIDVSEKIQGALEKAAAAAGMSVSGYANLVMEERLGGEARTEEERLNAVDRLIERMRTSQATSGRDGRGWREFIHEGHAG